MLLVGIIAIIIGLTLLTLSPLAARVDRVEGEQKSRNIDPWLRAANPKLGLAMVALGVVLTMLPYFFVWWHP